MADNLKHPFDVPPPPSSSAGEKETESEEEEEEDEEDQHQRSIFSSEEDEPEDSPPRSGSKKEDACGSSESQLTGRKRLSTNASSKVAKKIFTRLFSEEDEIVLLQGIIDYKGKKNPLEHKRSFYQSMKGSFSFDVEFKQFTDKIRHLQKQYTAREKKSGEEGSTLNPHQQKCFLLSKAVWGDGGVAAESAVSSNGKSKESGRRLTRKGKNVQEGSKRGEREKSPLVVEKESGWDESLFFLGVDFLKEKWTKVPTESKKETQEKMKKLHANELECQKFEEMLKAMKDKCAHDKVELWNEVTSLILATDKMHI